MTAPCVRAVTASDVPLPFCAVCHTPMPPAQEDPMGTVYEPYDTHKAAHARRLDRIDTAVCVAGLTWGVLVVWGMRMRAKAGRG